MRHSAVHSPLLVDILDYTPYGRRSSQTSTFSLLAPYPTVPTASPPDTGYCMQPDKSTVSYTPSAADTWTQGATGISTQPDYDPNLQPGAMSFSTRGLESPLYSCLGGSAVAETSSLMPEELSGRLDPSLDETPGSKGDHCHSASSRSSDNDTTSMGPPLWPASRRPGSHGSASRRSPRHGATGPSVPDEDSSLRHTDDKRFHSVLEKLERHSLKLSHISSRMKTLEKCFTGLIADEQGQIRQLSTCSRGHVLSLKELQSLLTAGASWSQVSGVSQLIAPSQASHPTGVPVTNMMPYASASHGSSERLPKRRREE